MEAVLHPRIFLVLQSEISSLILGLKLFCLICKVMRANDDWSDDYGANDETMH